MTPDNKAVTPATDGRKWKAQYTEVTPDHMGYYIYNPKGEMVAIIYEQDRPESDGFVYLVVDGLNSIARIDQDRAQWERELGEPVAWAWEWTENEGLTTKREIYTDREVVAVRAHMFGGVCVPLYALNVKWGE